jgi:hypothetical protein
MPMTKHTLELELDPDSPSKPFLPAGKPIGIDPWSMYQLLLFRYNKGNSIQNGQIDKQKTDGGVTMILQNKRIIRSPYRAQGPNPNPSPRPNLSPAFLRNLSAVSGRKIGFVT